MIRFIDTEKFDWQNVKSCALLSQLAYKPPAVFENVAKEAGFKECQFIEDKETDTQAYCIADGNLVVIAFRGTESIRDFIQDAKFKRVALEFPSSGISCTQAFSKDRLPTVKYGNVHRGFKEALESVWLGIRGFIQKHPNAKVFLTGHSLGAALAVLLASRLEVSGHNIRAVYTFGCPRVGNSVFARIANDRFNHFRMRNNNDAVTRLPPRPLYKHSGFQYYWNVRGEIVVLSWFGHMTDHLAGRWQSFKARFKKGGAFKSTDGIADHGMDGYKSLSDIN
jgi:triacylglycerol lipase